MPVQKPRWIHDTQNDSYTAQMGQVRLVVSPVYAKPDRWKYVVSFTEYRLLHKSVSSTIVKFSREAAMAEAIERAEGFFKDYPDLKEV